MKKLIGVLMVGVLMFFGAGPGLAANPDTYDSAYAAAKALMDAGSNAEAIKATQAIAENKSFPYTGRAECLTYACRMIGSTDKKAALDYMTKAAAFGLPDRVYECYRLTILWEIGDLDLVIKTANETMGDLECVSSYFLWLCAAKKGNKQEALANARRSILAGDRSDLTLASNVWNWLERNTPTLLDSDEHKKLVEEINRAYPPPGQDVNVWADFISKVRFRLESLSTQQ